MTEDIIEAIDALLRQPLCGTDREMGQEIQQWRQELMDIKERFDQVTEASERLVLEESCRNVMAQMESRLATANLFQVSPQVEYATFELASTLTALTAANTLATVKENIHQVLTSLLQDIQTELRAMFAQERSNTLGILQREVSALFHHSPPQLSPYQDPDVLHWLNGQLRALSLTEAEIGEMEAAHNLEPLSEDPLATLVLPEITDIDQSLTPPSSQDFIQTIDIDLETIEDQLNAFADREEISFTIPGASTIADPPCLPPLPSTPKGDIHDSWFLGIDFGATQVQATLSNLTTGQLYPLMFESEKTALSTTVMFATATGETLPVQHYKTILQLGLPYLCDHKWQPVIQWSSQQRIPLHTFLVGARQLLLRLKESATHPQLANVPDILNHLSGVVFGHPSAWADAYIFNLREIILDIELSRNPEQVIAVPQILSPLLATLHFQESLADSSLFIDGGFASTELLLIRRKPGSPLHADHLFYQGVDHAGEQISLDLLREFFALPLKGIVSIEDPLELSQYLKSSPQGRSLMALATSIKAHLSLEDTWQGTWEEVSITITRSAYTHRVVHPFLQVLNRNMNSLLIRSGLFAENIEALNLSGGTMQCPILQEWLSQKFPNAHIEWKPSQAQGLAVAARFYGLLDLSHQQYSDFFLLHEICKLNWQEPMHPATILQQLQQRGINVHSCVHRVISILQNNLPVGIMPQGPLIVPDPIVQSMLTTGGVFSRQENGCYAPDRRKLQWVDSYLEQVCSHLHQSISEPMVFTTLNDLVGGAAEG